MKPVDRILTIVVTATLTSAFWIVMGGSLLDNAQSASQRDDTRPADAVPSPSASLPLEAGGETPVSDEARASQSLDTQSAKQVDNAQSDQLMIPVLNIRPSDLTDTFTDARGGGTRLHEALDIMAPRGTTVVAAAPGEVEKLFHSDAGGNTIYVRSNDGTTIYYYAHLQEYAEGLKEGQRVRRGQRLGSVGSSGNASKEAPHLHFAILQTTEDAEWWEPAHAVNPYPILRGR